MLSHAPAGLKIVLLILLCGACLSGLTGLIAGDGQLVLIALSLVAVSAVIILVWRLNRGTDGDTDI